jgi:hypothetical protein
MEWQTKLVIPYRALTLGQKSIIVNGCGAQGSSFRPPHAKLFRDVCGEHDYDYAVGGSLLDKVKADWRLRRRIINKVKVTGTLVLRDNLYLDDSMLPDWVVRQVYYAWADVYFTGVMLGGHSSFRYAKQKQWPMPPLEKQHGEKEKRLQTRVRTISW